MLYGYSFFSTLTIISCSCTAFGILINLVTDAFPITGIWLLFYILVHFFVSLLFSFKFLQWLLHLNKPIKYNLDGLVNDYPYLSFLRRVLPRTQKSTDEEFKEYDTNELSVITTVLERKLVSSWYMPFVSQEIGFPFACKQMLDQMIGKTFQICNQIEPKDVFVDMCSILIMHLKEYRKALKRHEKSPNDTIESLYKNSHPISNNSDKKIESAEHCTNVLRIVIKELVPWELWDTAHLELLVRILSKKLDNFIDSTLADPNWLNDKLLIILKNKEQTKPETEEKVKTSDQEEVKQEVIDEPVIEPKLEKPTVESALSTLITKTTAPILQRAIDEELNDDLLLPNEGLGIVEEVPVNTTEPVDIKSSPVLRQKRGRQGRNEVKIYDRIIEGSVKTWETDIDLRCISLGQDLLASLDGEITLSRLWGQDAEADGSPNPPMSKSPQPLWFGEEDAIDVDADSPPKETSPARKEHSPKPADALLKDLQTTVHQAKTKIGDLQVTNLNVHVPRKQYSGDEAAGMMEGLLDFGIAGLKKGLRFTGLSDDAQEKSPSHREKGAERMSPPEIGKAKSVVIPIHAEKEAIASSVIQKEDNGSTVPPLVKQQRVISQDSVPSQARPIPREAPPLLLSDSPEPEYEEAADLSTSIAKLRHLLQRAEVAPSGRVEDVWWERAEETRGRTHTQHSSRPVDTATFADEYELQAERASPQTSNNMQQRFDKLFQRTVTGMFNSIKTAVAVGADEEAPRDAREWTYVCTSVELSVGGAVARLVGSRRALSHVDAALDSLSHLPPPPQDHTLPPLDLEEWCAARGGAWAAGGELAAGARLVRSHVAHTLASLLLADLAEALIEVWLSELTAWLRQQVFAIFKQMAEGETAPSAGVKSPPPADLNRTCDAIMENMPAVLHVFGKQTLTDAVRLTLHSFSHQQVNKDVIFRALDLLAVHFKKSAELRNPSFDAS